MHDDAPYHLHMLWQIGPHPFSLLTSISKFFVFECLAQHSDLKWLHLRYACKPQKNDRLPAPGYDSNTPLLNMEPAICLGTWLI